MGVDSCKAFAKLVYAILDGEATEDEKDCFEKHYGKCGHCLEVFNIEKSTLELIRQKIRKESVPLGLEEAIKRKIGELIVP